MGNIKSIGFPRIDKEISEKRDFTPEFFENLVGNNLLVLEKGYGEKLGFTESAYTEANEHITFREREEVFKSDVLIVIRSPELEWLHKMRDGSTLISMLHYETRPKYLKVLEDKKINAFSLDAIMDDANKRLVVTYELTAFAGVKSAFEAHKNLIDSNQKIDGPLTVSIVGIGNLGVLSGRFSFEMYRNLNYEQLGFKGIVVRYLEKDITQHHSSMEKQLRDTDILIDATRRPDPTQVIIPNNLISSLSENAVILDLSADPYDMVNGKIQLKAIEGIPHGTLDKYVFEKQDRFVKNMIPESVQSEHFRSTVSCNAWPGVLPKECMDIYSEKMLPLVNLLIRQDFQVESDSSDFYERALFRSTILYHKTTQA
ncbi:hypothetical protein J22TS1_48590 [Siminovitchia terrae]|uniref:hypothetical protein n=1 Tax=Siminovitchia terrae TaxID=1914933 RepID=UPI001B1CC289|nr:hypothetical protein [Siminovitchia terrae]GIN93808.1 hypothetical protein J22TS1_48590 [Siminovitchia terrae]